MRPIFPPRSSWPTHRDFAALMRKASFARMLLVAGITCLNPTICHIKWPPNICFGNAGCHGTSLAVAGASETDRSSKENPEDKCSAEKHLAEKHLAEKQIAEKQIAEKKPDDVQPGSKPRNLQPAHPKPGRVGGQEEEQAASPDIGRTLRNVADVAKVTSPAGEIRDAKLSELSGWETLRAVSVQLFSKSKDQDEFHVVPHDKVFRTGDILRVHLESSADMHYCVAVKNADGTFNVLLPAGVDPVPKARRRTPVVVPKPPYWEFLLPVGKERLFLFMFAEQPPFLITPELREYLERLSEGKKLTAEETSALSNLRSVRSRGLKQLEENAQKIFVPSSMDKVLDEIRTGLRARGAAVTAIEKEDQFTRVYIQGSKSKDPQEILAIIVLDHK